MIELPEALALAAQLDRYAAGKMAVKVWPPSSIHKFCFYEGDAAEYDARLSGRRIEKCEAFGIYVELSFAGGVRLCFNDGVNPRLLAPEEARPKKYQLLIDFSDGWSLVFTVAMYGAIICHTGVYENKYYQKSRTGISPLCEAFDFTCFCTLADDAKPNLSLKAFLAAEQRIPGLGNGVLQDILFEAGLHPKRKLDTLSAGEKETLFQSVKRVLAEMAAKGGRDTEKNIFGNAGGYVTRLSKKTLAGGCPRCGGPITKEAYLGGAIYYCPVCQPVDSAKRRTEE
ncbi:MAG: endonuclease VIII [Oscillospiraceae bacterium]|nr:endonuclease VIII [Oscillospiraceae bacterium]